MSILGELLQINNRVMAEKANEAEKAQELLENAKTLEDIRTQTNTYNKNIPVVFGMASLAGNIIWTGTLTSHLMKEGGASIQDAIYDNYIGSKLRQTRSTNATFSMIYNLDFAIGICEGEVDRLLEVKANEATLDLSKYKYRFYCGSKTQNPDPLISEMQGIGKTPAFRNLCYIVFEDFPISDFNNAIPNFIFTVERNTVDDDNSVSRKVKGITIIPGTGEFVYHTEKIAKYEVAYSPHGDVLLEDTKQPCNYHNNEGRANVLVSLDNLKKELPNVEWISLIVCWFGNSLDIASCSIYPACEFNDVYQKTAPYDWSVGGKNRRNARVISKDSKGNLLYGGTPSDSSVVALLKELKARGYKIFLIPMIMMELESKPWRGRITGSSGAVAGFFEKADGYNNFIRHYANLGKDFVDAFAIGSELIGLTKINDGHNNFPAVDKLCELAGEIRQTMGKDVKLTYAADWSEYHHTNGGIYNMDKLWANPDIDFIGIDAYLPLTNTVTRPSQDEIKQGWYSGEGWDFYYNQDRTVKFPMSQEWAWKNIRWFVENDHTNADSTPSLWQKNMKKVWFCEYGFPSVDLCTNQPNVFYDPTSSESFFPRNSMGYVDFQSQSDAIIATEEYWEGSNLVKNKFLWAWDARPYPFFPRLANVWSDSANWKYGHWVCGKVLYASVASIIKFCFDRVGITNYKITNVSGVTSGMVIAGGKSVLGILKSVLLAYNLVIYEENGIIKVNSIAKLNNITKFRGDILIDESKSEILNSIIVKNGEQTVRKLNLMYYDVDKEYQISHVYAEDLQNQNGIENVISVPFVLTAVAAKDLAGKALAVLNATTRQEMLFSYENRIDIAKILSIIDEGTPGIISRINHDMYTSKVQVTLLPPMLMERIMMPVTQESSLPDLNIIQDLSLPILEIIDIHNFTNIALVEGTFALWFAFRNVPAVGATVYYSINGDFFTKMFDVYRNSITGKVISPNLQNINSNVKDETNTIQVALNNKNVLVSGTEGDLLSHKNLSIIGDELISFQNATQVATGVYDISTIVHARFGTDFDPLINGKRFIYLQSNIRQFMFPLSVNKLYFKIVPHGDIIEDAPSIEFVPQKNSVKNWRIQSTEKTLIGDDILISWKEHQTIDNIYFSPSKTFLANFVVNINDRRVVNVHGENRFLYTKAMQDADGITFQTLNVTVMQ